MDTLSTEWPRSHLKLYSSAELPIGTMESSAESPLRAALEREFDEKLKAAKDAFEQRLCTITEHSRRFLEEAKSDDVIRTMRESHVSEQFAAHRMKELHDEEMAREREETIDRLTHEIVQLRGDQGKLTHELQALSAALRTAEDALRVEKAKSDDLKTQLQRATAAFEEKRRREVELAKRSDEVQFERLQAKRAQEQAQRLEGQARAAGEQVDAVARELQGERSRNEELQQAVEHLQAELQDVVTKYEDLRKRTSGQTTAELQRQLQRARKEVEQLSDALRSADSEKSSIHEQLSQYESEVKEALEAEDEARKEAFEGLKKKFKAKSRLFKKKITDQKATIEHITAQLRATEESLDQQHREWEFRTLAVQEDLRRVRDEWERKCQEVQMDAKRREAELTAKQQLQLSGLKGQYQQLLDQKVNELQADIDSQASRVRSQDSELRRAMEQRIQDLEREHKTHLDQLLRDQQLLNRQEMELRLRTQREKSSIELSSLQQDLDRARQELETCKSTAGGKMKELDEARRQTEDSVRTQQSLVQKLEEAVASLSGLRLTREAEARRLAQAEDALQQANSDLGEKDKQLSRLAREAAAWQESCAKVEADRKKTQIEVQEQAKEWADKDKSRSQDHQTQIARLQSEISEYERRLTDLRQSLRSNDQELLQIKQQLLEAHLSATHTLKREQQRREEDAGRQRDAFRAVVQQIQALRSGFASLRVHVESDLRLHWKDLSATSQTIAYEVSEHETAMQRINATQLREAIDESELRFSEKVKEMESELSLQTNTSMTFQEQIVGKEKHLDALRAAAQQLKRENQSAAEENDRIRGENMTLRLAQEQLSAKLKENSRAFDDLQHEVQMEAGRLRAECDALRRELAKKNEESAGLVRTAEEARRRIGEEARSSQEEVRRVREQQTAELTELKRKYEKVVDQLAEERDSEKERSTRLRAQVVDLRARVDSLQSHMEKSLKSAEDQVRSLERSFRSEEERLVKAKLEKASDIDSLSERLLQVTEELRARERQCAELQKEKRGMTDQAIDLEKQLQILMQELSDLRTAKDREIESLRGVVNRSYTDSMDQVRKAKELDRETKELAAQIRKPPVRRSGEVPERGTSQ